MTPLRVQELPRRLAERIEPIYLVAGEEPLLIEEALTELRAAARAWGAAERQVLHAEPGFDWGQLLSARDSLSLFAERRLIELRLPSGKPGKDGAEALQAYAARPPGDTVLTVVCGRLERRQREAAWASALAGAGVMAYAWPVRGAELPRWLAQRMHSRGLRPERAALALLAERAEGNLLAAAQEVDKLELLRGPGAIDTAAVREAASDSARFDVFDLSAAVLSGDRRRVVRIMAMLRESGAEPTLVLWALARDLRVLALLCGARSGAGEVFRAQRIWKPQQASYQRCARRAPKGAWETLLRHAGAVDRVIKGAEGGRPWDELVHLASNTAACASGQALLTERQ